MRAGKVAVFSVLSAIALAVAAVTVGDTPAPSVRADQRVAQTPPTPSASAANRWRQGGHYGLVNPAQATSVGPDKVEVLEVFWYGCPHCYQLEPYLQKWETTKPAYIQLIRIPATWSEPYELHARLFYTLQALKPELHLTAFREAHFSDTYLLGNDAPSTEKLHTAFAKRHGIDEAKFKATYNSKEVTDQIKAADALIRRYKLDSVPYMLINGKYKADVNSAGGQSQLISLVTDLAAKEHQGK